MRGLRWPRGRLRYGLVKRARETPCLLPIEGGSISTNTHCNHSITYDAVHAATSSLGTSNLQSVTPRPQGP